MQIHEINMEFKISNFRLFVFDLDGTLVKSDITIYKSMTDALKQIGIKKEVPFGKFKSMIGHHFIDIFNEIGIELQDFNEYLTIYKQNYFVYLPESEIYEGVHRTLDTLDGSGYKLAVLTTKMQEQADKILKILKLDNYFDLIRGRIDGKPHKPEPDPLLDICSELNVNAGDTLMIGDTELDIRCGKNAGTKTAGVNYGYRTLQQIKDENPDYIFDNLTELLSIAKK